MTQSIDPMTPVVPDQPAPEIVFSSGGAVDQQLLRNIGLIIGREYKNRVKQRSFIISTIVLLVLLVLLSCVPTVIQFITSKVNVQTHIALVDDNANSIANLSGGQLLQYFATSLNGPKNQSQNSSSSTPAPYVLQSASADRINSLRQSVKNGDLSILLVVNRASDQSLQFTYYTNVDITSDGHLTQVEGAADQLSVLDKAERLGLTSQQTANLFAQPAFIFVDTQQNTRSVGEQVAGYFTAYAGVLLIFMSVFLYGNGVAMGVAEEKGSRIMEILINAATPFQLMVGKIVGIGAAGLTQMGCLVVVGIAALEAQRPLQVALLGPNAPALLGFDFTSVSITVLELVLVYFILGFLLYAGLFAALGSLVKRQDEVQNAILPVTWLFMIGYIASLAGGTVSAGTVWMKVLSFIPFWTPTVMLMRIGTGVVGWGEVVVSILIMLVSIVICTFFAARVYRFSVLMYGQKPGLWQLVRLASMK